MRTFQRKETESSKTLQEQIENVSKIVNSVKCTLDTGL